VTGVDCECPSQFGICVCEADSRFEAQFVQRVLGIDVDKLRDEIQRLAPYVDRNDRAMKYRGNPLGLLFAQTE
jgi:hypothetical protein